MVVFDTRTEAKLYEVLRRAFPDARLGNADIVALAVALRSAGQSRTPLPGPLASIDLSPYARDLDGAAAKYPVGGLTHCPRGPQDEFRYYWAKATHTRKTPSGFEPFVGELAMARVRLPDSVPKAIDTAIGGVEPGDHLIDTVFEANQKYQTSLGYPLARVDCITPTRQGVRFGAISILLGYRDENGPPTCYILEAGTATGQPKVLYLGKAIGTTINAWSGYQPTPFACPTHAYTGQLTLTGDDPKLLHITSRTVNGGTSQAPYIDISIEFTLQTDDVSTIWPGFLIARAAMIVLERELSGKIPKDCPAPKEAPPAR
jgi:hypothetical protein